MSTSQNQIDPQEQIDSDLEFVRTTRMKLIESYLDPKVAAERDPKTDAVLIELLKDTDRTSLAKTKIKVDKGKAESQAELAASLAQLLTTHHVKGQRMGNVDYSKVGVPDLPTNLATPEIVEGEFSDISTTTQSYDQFMAKQNQS